MGRTPTQLTQSTWEERNEIINGSIKQEATEKERQRLFATVWSLYTNPPSLAKHFPIIQSVPYQDRIKATSNQLKWWIARVEHQKRVSYALAPHPSDGQLTLTQTYGTRHRKHSSNSSFL
jgi:hypothetical protein